jgi:hypothetical protein
MLSRRGPAARRKPGRIALEQETVPSFLFEKIREADLGRAISTTHQNEFPAWQSEFLVDLLRVPVEERVFVDRTVVSPERARRHIEPAVVRPVNKGAGCRSSDAHSSRGPPMAAEVDRD